MVCNSFRQFIQSWQLFRLSYSLRLLVLLLPELQEQLPVVDALRAVAVLSVPAAVAPAGAAEPVRRARVADGRAPRPVRQGELGAAPTVEAHQAVGLEVIGGWKESRKEEDKN